MTIGFVSSKLTHPQKKYFERRSMLPLRRNALWEIQSGVVRTFTCLENGTLVTFGLWGKGDMVSPLLSKVDPYYLECLTEVQVILRPLTDYYEVNQALIAQIHQFNDLMAIKQSRPVDDALLKLLAWLGKKFGREVEEGHLIDLRLTHQEIAEIIGTTRVTVTRLLGVLEQQKMIKRSDQKSIILYEPVWYYQI